MSRPLTYLRLTLTAIIWGSIYPLGAWAVKSMPPVAVGAWRFGLAGLLLVPIVQRREGWSLPALRHNALALIAMALSGVFLFNLALFNGLTSTTAVNAALIMALSPAMTTVLSAALRRRPVRPLQWLGLASGVAGVACIASGGSLPVLLHLRVQRGDGLMMLASLCWSLYAVIPERWIRDSSPLQVTAASSLIGATGLAAVALLHGPAPLRIASPALALVLLYFALFGSVLALTWWNEGIARFGATRTTLFMNLVPVSAALIAVALGQPLTGAALAGAALVILGVSVAVSQRQ